MDGAADPRASAGSRKRSCAAALSLAALVVVVFLPAVFNGFVNWDDDVYVVDNPAISAADGLRQIWSTIEMPDGFPNYPLVFTSYWLEHRIWGLNPRGYHVTNVLLHGFNTALVFLLLQALGVAPWAAGLSAALFGLHPVQVESVAWITERKNVLSGTFCLASFLAYLRHRASGRWWWYAVSLSAFACALLSKTAMVVLPLSIALADRWRVGRPKAGSLYRLLPMFVLAAVAGILTLSTEGRPLSVALPARPMLAAACLWFYLGTLLVPVSLSPVYPRWEVSLTQFGWWMPLFGLLLALVIVHRWVGNRHVRWGLAHFACMLLPVLGLRPFGFNEYSFVADRHVYIACIGVFLSLSIALEQLRRVGRRDVTILACLAGASLIGLTWKQIVIWRNSVTLWSAVLARNPQAMVARNNLGMALVDFGRLPEAAFELYAELAYMPDNPNVHNNLALVFYRQGNFSAAEYHCRRALAVEPGAAGFHKNLGLVLQAQGQLAAAEGEFRHALQLQPEAGYHYLLAGVLATQGRTDEAAQQLDSTLRLRPDFPGARESLIALRAEEPARP
jgi:hypothetical protein